MINFKGFVDTTLRDGQASPLLYDTKKYAFTLDEKKQIVKALISLGVTYIEFYSPVVSKIERNDFIEIKKTVEDMTMKKITLIAHCRCVHEDIDQAMECGFNGLNLYMGLSEFAQKYSYAKNLKDLSVLIKDIVVSARRKYPDVYMRYSGEDAFRTPLKSLFSVYDELYGLVDTFGIPDTTGTATPEVVRSRVKSFKKRYPKANLECHFHNDRGFSLVNSLAAVKAGAEFIDTSILGISERSGISSVTGLLLNLYSEDEDLVKKFNIELSYPINVLLASILDIQVPWNEPVSLTNRTHIAGVHQKAVLNNTATYEAHNLEKFGVTKEQLLLGPLTGWNFIYYFLKEVENFMISQDQAKEITLDFKTKTKELRKKIKPEKILIDLALKYSLSRNPIPQDAQNQRLENLNR